MSKYTERDMSMAKEKLKMDSAQIAQIMGTVGSPLIVISELLKNAVDASAENIDIYYDFDSRSITVENDYKGFTFEEIQNLSRPGISAKKKGKNLTNERGMFLMICTPFTGHPVEGVLLCGTHMSTKGNV